MNMKDKMHAEELYLQTIRKLRQSSFFALIGSIHSTQPDRPNRTGGRSCCAQCLRKSAATATSNRPFMPIGGGKHVHFGNQIYASFNLTLVDDTHIYV